MCETIYVTADTVLFLQGFFRRAEVLRAMGGSGSGYYRTNTKRNCYREDALKDYLTSYNYENDVTTFCKCFTLAVDLSMCDVKWLTCVLLIC